MGKGLNVFARVKEWLALRQRSLLDALSGSFSMSNKTIRGEISLREIPFQFQSQYVWTIQLNGVKADGSLKRLGFISEPTEIKEPWAFMFHIEEPSVDRDIQQYDLRVEVLDGHVLIADADHRFPVDRQGDAPTVQHLVLQPQYI